VGFSSLFARPAYQDGVPGIGSVRGVPDVSADANPHFAMALVISEGAGKYIIRNSGGTSAAAPLWAALIALADQYAGRHLGFINPAIYHIAQSPAYHQAFHDVTSGNNTVQFPPVTITGYNAGPAGTRSPAGAPPTRRTSSRSSPNSDRLRVIGLNSQENPDDKLPDPAVR
jgi:subtilase family serine protease